MLHFLFVGATAADALAIGYRTVLIDDCSRGVDLKDIEKTKNTVTSNNGVIVDSSQVGLFLTQYRVTYYTRLPCNRFVPSVSS
jgi:hypothetical protein